MGKHIPAILFLLCVCSVVLGSVRVPAPVSNARTTDEAGAALEVSVQGDTVLLEWRAGQEGTRTQASALPDLPLVEMGGMRLPAALVALRVPADAVVNPKLEQVESLPWVGTLSPADVPIPQTSTGEERPALAVQPARQLPAAPVLMLREGRMRGQRIIVLALSPLFAADGQTQMATHVRASIPGATLLSGSATERRALLEAMADPAPFLADAPAPASTLASRTVIALQVEQAGMQRVSGTALAAAGIDIATLDPAALQLYRNGTPVRLEARGTQDGTLEATDELRFYATPPGDRWNATDTYWLLRLPEADPRRIMKLRSAAPGTAPLRTTSYEQGTWQDNTSYDSTMPGADGDHWFAANLRTGPGQQAATLSVPLTPTLPLVAGSMLLTVTGTAYTPGPHRLRVQAGTLSRETTWEDTGDFAHTLAFPQGAASAVLHLLPGDEPSGVLMDSVGWERAVALDANGQGALFVGTPGTWRYQVRNPPADGSLYDISDPAAPLRLTGTISTASALVFQDETPAGTERRYLLAGAGTLHTPQISTRPLAHIADLSRGNVIYIAPAAWHPALAPLVAHRQAQGYSVALVDVQHIYDLWSYGQVSPDAIRNFLRYAAATWNPAPLAATLVGDGTADPRDYLGHGNASHIPPYLADVDLWLGETACDACYAQLDGIDPLSDPMPDIMLGRLPVNSAQELEQLVGKIVGYESAPDDGSLWRSRAVYLADNYREASGAIDGAGDFAAAAEESAALQPPGIHIERVYYAPFLAQGSTSAWYEPDATRAHERTLAALNTGAATVMYIGHSHHWQWAVTDLEAETSYLLGLYDPDSLSNGERLPVVLAMTCLSSAFHQPARRPTTIDERLLLSNTGGAVAVWGPTGLGVAHGHDALQRGFYQALWAASGQAAVGGLVQAGYVELFERGNCCQDALRTFVLLGDPLTQMRMAEARSLYLPLIQR